MEDQDRDASHSRKVYVNLQVQNLSIIIDPATDEVNARYPVGHCKGNHGMALDPELMQPVSHGQVHRVGDGGVTALARALALAPGVSQFGGGRSTG